MEIFDVVLSLSALVILEIVLGIDNLVILSILTEKLPTEKRKKARQWGLTFAWMTRLLLLATAASMVKLVHPLVTIGSLVFSTRDLFLIFGGAFLIWKSTDEIHHDVVDEPLEQPITTHLRSAATFRNVVIQIATLDIIFSLDSVLTAVGLTSHFWVMALAITIAIIIMIWASEPVSHFISKHPTIKMLALSYLILIGMVLVADGFQFHIPRGYLYFAMGFSLAVESLNLIKSERTKRKRSKG
ncbi:TerC family protein [Legionella waltersii]|uniref:Transport protein n=1 Tax=Legionella waltersii TaxID=66969 RepID=A0A0W1A108_9GAMM|nr:TerC family protein [Legionella waltersii]KTD75061.1 transport protein [Legionella waltersii]SNV05319.1 transporter [Legionella waltersii]